MCLCSHDLLAPFPSLSHTHTPYRRVTLMVINTTFLFASPSEGCHMTKDVQSHLYDCVSFPSLSHTHTNLYRYFSSAAVIRMQQMLSIDACQSLILSSPTFNLPSCCATNPVSCHFLRSSDCSLKAPSPPDKEEGNRHCLATDTPAPAPPSLRSPKLKGRPALAPP